MPTNNNAFHFSVLCYLLKPNVFITCNFKISSCSDSVFLMLFIIFHLINYNRGRAKPQLHHEINIEKNTEDH